MSKEVRLICLKSRTVSWHPVDDIQWSKVWTITHPWDRDEETRIPLEGVTWKSQSFSSEGRFNLVFEKTRRVVEPLGGEYVWADAACINQESEEEKKEQLPLMATVFSKGAGTVAFGTLPPGDNQFAPMISTHDNGRKAWVCDWFERVWTLQELQLPDKVLFVSGGDVLTRDEVYFFILMMSPYLTPSYPSPPRCPNDPRLSIHDVLNALSPKSRFITQRALMQASRRGCSSRSMHDKIYSILAVVARGAYSQLKVDYDAPFEHVVLSLMKMLSTMDVMDTLVYNLLPPADGVHDAFNWSGMIMMSQPTEQPAYETDLYHATQAVVIVDGEPLRATTVVYNAPLWKVVVTKPKNVQEDHAQVLTWPSITVLSQCAKLTEDFSRVERSVEHVSVIERVERSLVANWERLELLLRKSVSDSDDEELSSLLHNPPSSSIPSNRLGDERLFDHEVTVLVCRSTVDRSFHFGIVVEPNKDLDDPHTWHKVCTAAFSDQCVLADRDHVESKVVIGR